MNYLNATIFIIATFLIVTGEFFSLHKHHNNNKWEGKSPKDRKIKKLGMEAVDQYNKDYYSNLKFIKVLEAKKKNTETDKHYSLKILAERECGYLSVDCSQEIGAEIYKRIKKPYKVSIYAYKD